MFGNLSLDSFFLGGSYLDSCEGGSNYSCGRFYRQAELQALSFGQWGWKLNSDELSLGVSLPETSSSPRFFVQHFSVGNGAIT